MNRRTLLVSAAFAFAFAATSAGVVQAKAPVQTTESYTEVIYDDFIFELCGIDTLTTVTERWTLKEYADGSAILHVNREFLPHDRRIPLERGAGTSFFAPDGTQTTVGSPTRLFDQDSHRLLLVDGGRVVFGDEVEIRGHVESFDVDLAEYYCP